MPLSLRAAAVRSGPEVFLEELGAGDPDSVLGGEGPAEPAAQGRNLVGNEPQPLDVLGPVQVEHRPDVQLARGGVAVVRGDELEGSENGLEPGDISRKSIGSDADILDARSGLCRSRPTGQQREPGLPQRPDELLPVGIGQHEPPIADTGLVERGEPSVHITEELDQEQRLARVFIEPEKIASGAERPLTDGLVEEDPVDVLHRRRLEPRHLHRRLHGIRQR